MKNLISKIFIIVFCLSSMGCNSQQQDPVKMLGAENYKVLNILLDDFETNVLRKKYPKLSVEEAYRELLQSIVKGEIKQNDIQVSEEIKTMFNKSRFKQQVFCVTDSVYIGKSEYDSASNRKTIIVLYNCLQTNNEVVTSRAEVYCCDDALQTEKMIEAYKESTQINLGGFFIEALKNSKNKSDFVSSYLEYIYLTGDNPSTLKLAMEILENKVKLTDYFTKALIVLITVYG